MSWRLRSHGLRGTAKALSLKQSPSLAQLALNYGIAQLMLKEAA
jgi:hypothetical protein